MIKKSGIDIFSLHINPVLLQSEIYLFFSSFSRVFYAGQVVSMHDTACCEKWIISLTQREEGEKVMEHVWEIKVWKRENMSGRKQILIKHIWKINLLFVLKYREEYGIQYVEKVTLKREGNFCCNWRTNLRLIYPSSMQFSLQHYLLYPLLVSSGVGLSDWIKFV